jgi:ADP-heptose:LPS heptosyltransferase
MLRADDGSSQNSMVAPRKLILKSFQSPGDIVMLTAAVRDLHLANPGAYQTDVRTSAPALWENNPHLTPLQEGDSNVRLVDMHYPLVHESNQRPYHFIHGYPQYLEQQLGIRVPLSRFYGDIYLTQAERDTPLPSGIPEHFWILVAGGKYDFTAKWWNPDYYQKLVDHFQGKICFVQCGEAGHWHPELRGVVNLVGKTTLREFIRLMHHADGVVCPVTFAMHLAAAVETKGGKKGQRPCVVVAGGREPAHWEAYPTHQYISTSGALSCCREGGCWKSRCQLVGDGDDKDRRDVCEQPVQLHEKLRIPKCMEMITPEDVIARIELYYRGGILNGVNGKTQAGTPGTAIQPTQGPTPMPANSTSVAFYHGLGDCAYFAHLIPLYLRRGHKIQVECTPDKAILFRAAGAEVVSKAGVVHSWGYPAGGTHMGQGRFWQGSKMGHNISEPPLPGIGSKEQLWDEYCQTRIDITAHLPDDAVATAKKWIGKLPRPVVLLHTKGNTGQERKSLPDDISREFYKAFLDLCDGSLILLDWDHRVPKMESYRVRHLDDFGGCNTETMLALMSQADLVVGVDSGPLHASRFTRTPTLGLWMPGHYPTTYTLPRPEQLNLVLSEHTKAWNRYKRIPWNIVEHPGSSFSAERIAQVCGQMLSPTRYLPNDMQAADVQLQQFVLEWCRGPVNSHLGAYTDRNRSFDVLLREMSRRFAQPTVVETGTIRAEEDWGGAGFFTHLMGAYLHRRGGALHSVDLSRENCEFARSWTRIFGETVRVTQQDSIQYLAKFPGSIDVLYLDSLDTTEAGHAEHCQRELEAALPKLHDKSLIVIDDTPWRHEAWVGKGAVAAPWLVQNGWRLLYAGYQVVFARE